MSFFFFNDTATTEIYTLSLHDALPILTSGTRSWSTRSSRNLTGAARATRSEEHTSELQSRLHLVCRLLLEKKKRRNADNLHRHINIVHNFSIGLMAHQLQFGADYRQLF